MKYWTSLFFVFVLSGCGQLVPRPLVIEEPTQQITQESQPEVLTQETEQPQEEETTAIEEGIEVRFEELTEENEEEHYSLDISYPQLMAPGDVNVSKVNEYMAQAIHDSVDSFVTETAAIEIDPSFFEGGFGSFYSIESSVAFLADQKIVTITFLESQYSAGAAHPYSYYTTMNFDLTTGGLITLDDLFMDDYIQQISDLSIQYLSASVEYPDESWIEGGAGPDLKNFQAFVLVENGLTLYFNPYQVASYAEGPQVITIPYKDLEEVIDASGPLRYLGFST